MCAILTFIMLVDSITHNAPAVAVSRLGARLARRRPHPHLDLASAIGRERHQKAGAGRRGEKEGRLAHYDARLVWQPTHARNNQLRRLPTCFVSRSCFVHRISSCIPALLQRRPCCLHRRPMTPTGFDSKLLERRVALHHSCRAKHAFSPWCSVPCRYRVYLNVTARSPCSLNSIGEYAFCSPFDNFFALCALILP